MKQFEMDCYEVREADGGGIHDNHVCYTSSPALAEKMVARSKGWRSYRPYNKLITIFDTEEEIESNTKAALIESAKAKLTVAERTALGI